MRISHQLRANKQHVKTYINNLVNEFAPLYVKSFKDKEIMGVEICKQDMRGCLSITLFDNRHCVLHQLHFLTQNECIAFMQGFMFCVRGY